MSKSISAEFYFLSLQELIDLLKMSRMVKFKGF